MYWQCLKLNRVSNVLRADWGFVNRFWYHPLNFIISFTESEEEAQEQQPAADFTEAALVEALQKVETGTVEPLDLSLLDNIPSDRSDEGKYIHFLREWGLI